MLDINALLNSIPTPSEADMAGRRQLARQYTLVFLRLSPTPRDDQAEDERIQVEHLQYLTKLQIAGKLILNGPTLVENDIAGVSVYAAPLEDARAMAEADPKVRAGYYVVEAIPWMAVPSKSHPE